MKDFKFLMVTAVLVTALVFSFTSPLTAQEPYMGDMVVYDGEAMTFEADVYGDPSVTQGMFGTDDSVMGMPLPVEWAGDSDDYEIQVVSFTAADDAYEYGEMDGPEGVWEVAD